MMSIIRADHKAGGKQENTWMHSFLDFTKICTNDNTKACNSGHLCSTQKVVYDSRVTPGNKWCSTPMVGWHVDYNAIQSHSAPWRAVVPMPPHCSGTRVCCPGPIPGEYLPSPACFSLAWASPGSLWCHSTADEVLCTNRVARACTEENRRWTQSLAARAAVGVLLTLSIAQVGIHLLLQGLIYSCLETKRALAILSHIYQMKRVLCCRCSGSNIWHTQNGSLLLSNTQARATKDYLREKVLIYHWQFFKVR